MAPEYDELLILAQTLGEVKTKTDKLEAEFSTQAKPFEAATSALYSAISGIKALQFHVLDNNLGKLSTRVEEMRQAINEQVGVIALELKKADAENATKAGQDADSLRAAIADVQANLGTLANQFVAQLQRVEFEAKEEAKKLQLIPGPAGAAGASLNPRGTFIDGETYNRLDVVSWLGSSYIAAVDGVKEKPSKNSNQWQVLASRGSGGAGGVGDFGSLAGVAQINQGGTGQTTRAAGLNALLPSQTGAVQYMLLTDGAGTVSWGAQPVAGLPSQTGNSGELLTTDGVNASWSNAVTVSGSNATVTGTLTVNGTGNSSFAGQLIQVADPATIALWKDATPTKAARFQFNTLADNGFSLGVYDGSSWFNAITVAPTTGVVKVPSTSASTSTSSGALVVSGGVGVAGAMNVGGSMKLNYLSTAGDPTALGVVQLYATTNTTSGAGGIEWKADTGGNGYGYRTLTVFDGVSAYDLYTQVRTNSASWTNSLILKSNGNATFSGSVQTSAPTGGTSAAWKLGTVATVSPTSPNRTIEVDIGGTIYYLAAKTTNN